MRSKKEVAAEIRPPAASSRGWTLIELVITITVLSVLTIGVIPLVRNSVRRQKEQRLREVLREMRTAIDSFKRDTVGMQCTAGGTAIQQQQQQQLQQGVPGITYVDPRSTVVLADCKLFGVDNPDRYPPDLQTLVDGVDVVPRLSAMGNQLGSVSTEGGGATANSGGLIPKKKVYLREIPADPITGERDWCLRSSYDTPDVGCTSTPENVFDVRSKSEATALNGEKYSEW
ncbi:MAG TPA: type II secretion system protein [Pyrinomonadaceae bacterium]|nr:type II secretion system protein [Pyrinomonadaceae bacterium]